MRKLTLLSGAAAVAAVMLTAAGLSAGARKPPPFAQTGNYRPVAGIVLKHSIRLADNLVGEQQATGSPGGVLGGRYQNELGLKWVRLGGGGLDWQSVEPEPGLYVTDPEVDALFKRWGGERIKIIVPLSATDGSEYPPDATRFADPREIERYTGYVRFMVRHFKGRIAYFEIWNEPNAEYGPGGQIPVARYSNLVKQVVPAIRAVDPNAKIVVGAVCNAPPGMEYGFPGYGRYGRYVLDVAYLKALITSGIAPLVDGISWHPMYGARADDPYYRTYPELATELQGLARAEGFRGRFFAEEMKWVTAYDGEDTWQQPVSRLIATKYLLRTIVTHRGLDFVTIIAIPQTSVLNWPLGIRGINNLLAGVTPATVPVRISAKAKWLRSYGFRRPNGARTLALWTDGLPRNNNPGTPATITLPGQAGHTATALDPLRAKQQKLVTTKKNGNLVIRGLLVRDYPIFIRLK